MDSTELGYVKRAEAADSLRNFTLFFIFIFTLLQAVNGIRMDLRCQKAEAAVEKMLEGVESARSALLADWLQNRDE